LACANLSFLRGSQSCLQLRKPCSKIMDVVGVAEGSEMVLQSQQACLETDRWSRLRNSQRSSRQLCRENDLGSHGIWAVPVSHTGLIRFQLANVQTG
jgi:hypothetical protein